MGSGLMTPELDRIKLKLDNISRAGCNIVHRAMFDRRGLTALEDRKLELSELRYRLAIAEYIRESSRCGRDVSSWLCDETRPKLRVTSNGSTPQFFVYGRIGSTFGGITSDEFRQALETVPGDRGIAVRINSEGGSFSESIDIYNHLRRRTGYITVSIDGLAASGGSLIAMAGNRIEMADGSWLMLHEPRASMRDGTADDFQRAADRLIVNREEMAAIYGTRWKGTQKTLRKALREEEWLTAAQAVDRGLADVANGTIAVAACINPKTRFKNTPATLQIAASAVANRIQLRRRKCNLRMHLLL